MTARLRAGLLAVLTAPGCAQLVNYGDDITRAESGRSSFVTVPATFGGVTGWLVGLPVSALALPITWPIYEVEKQRAPLKADKISTLLFPSFALWKAGGIVVGAPFDVVEYAAWRSWHTPPERSALEQEVFESELDQLELPSYPVEAIYPPPSAASGG